MTRLPRPGEINRDTDLRIAVLADAPWYDEVLADLDRIKEKPKAEIAPAFAIRYPEEEGHHDHEYSAAGHLASILLFIALLGAFAYGLMSMSERAPQASKKQAQMCQRQNDSRQANADIWTIAAAKARGVGRLRAAQRLEEAARNLELEKVDCHEALK